MEGLRSKIGENFGRAKLPPVCQSTGTQRRASGGNPDPAHACTETGNETGIGNEKEAARPKLVSVKIPGEEPKAVPEPKKPRKKRVTKKDSIDKSQLSLLIVGVSAAVAARPNFESMILTADEADKIADPLSNIINNSEALKTVAEHSDGIALLAACVMILTPKVMVTASKLKKAPKKGGAINERKEKAIDRNSRANDSAVAHDDPKSSDGLLAGLAPLA